MLKKQQHFSSETCYANIYLLDGIVEIPFVVALIERLKKDKLWFEPHSLSTFIAQQTASWFKNCVRSFLITKY